MTEDDMEKIVAEYGIVELLDIFGLTELEIFVILYSSGMLDETLLEELRPL